MHRESGKNEKFHEYYDTTSDKQKLLLALTTTFDKQKLLLHNRKQMFEE